MSARRSGIQRKGAKAQWRKGLKRGMSARVSDRRSRVSVPVIPSLLTVIPAKAGIQRAAVDVVAARLALASRERVMLTCANN